MSFFKAFGLQICVEGLGEPMLVKLWQLKTASLVLQHSSIALLVRMWDDAGGGRILTAYYWKTGLGLHSTTARFSEFYPT